MAREHVAFDGETYTISLVPNMVLGQDLPINLRVVAHPVYRRSNSHDLAQLPRAGCSFPQFWVCRDGLSWEQTVESLFTLLNRRLVLLVLTDPHRDDTVPSPFYIPGCVLSFFVSSK